MKKIIYSLGLSIGMVTGMAFFALSGVSAQIIPCPLEGWRGHPCMDNDKICYASGVYKYGYYLSTDPIDDIFKDELNPDGTVAYKDPYFSYSIWFINHGSYHTLHDALLLAESKIIQLKKADPQGIYITNIVKQKNNTPGYTPSKYTVIGYVEVLQQRAATGDCNSTQFIYQCRLSQQLGGDIKSDDATCSYRSSESSVRKCGRCPYMPMPMIDSSEGNTGGGIGVGGGNGAGGNESGNTGGGGEGGNGAGNETGGSGTGGGDGGTQGGLGDECGGGIINTCRPGLLCLNENNNPVGPGEKGTCKQPTWRKANSSGASSLISRFNSFGKSFAALFSTPLKTQTPSQKTPPQTQIIIKGSDASDVIGAPCDE